MFAPLSQIVKLSDLSLKLRRFPQRPELDTDNRDRGQRRPSVVRLQARLKQAKFIRQESKFDSDNVASAGSVLSTSTLGWYCQCSRS